MGPRVIVAQKSVGELTATVQAVEETSIHESPDFEKVQEKRTDTHEAMVDDGGNNDTDIQEVTVESIKETEAPYVLLAEKKSLSPPCSPPQSRGPGILQWSCTLAPFYLPLRTC